MSWAFLWSVLGLPVRQKQGPPSAGCWRFYCFLLQWVLNAVSISSVTLTLMDKSETEAANAF
eukprot:1159119-Pelagomonas_calceolata.AAC.1